MAPVIEAVKISAGYSGHPAISDVSLNVSRGEIVVLLGPNGAGKTTTVGALAGRMQLLGGEVCWEGTPVRSPLFKRARLGLSLVPDSRGLIRSATVLGNLRLGPGEPREALDVFPELEALLNRRLGLLSGGEQQMVAVARALATKPKLLVADELSLGLAPLAVDRLLYAIHSAAQQGTAVLLVEQHTRKALAVADRAYVMQRGRIVMEGDASGMSRRLGDIHRSYLPGTQPSEYGSRL